MLIIIITNKKRTSTAPIKTTKYIHPRNSALRKKQSEAKLILEDIKQRTAFTAFSAEIKDNPEIRPINKKGRKLCKKKRVTS